MGNPCHTIYRLGLSLELVQKGIPKRGSFLPPLGGYPQKGYIAPKRVPLGLRTVAVIYPKMSLFKWAKSTPPGGTPPKRVHFRPPFKRVLFHPHLKSLKSGPKVKKVGKNNSV